MKFFNLKCYSCGHTWDDICISYICPKCHERKILLLNQRGQSIIGVMIGIVVASILTLFIANMTVYMIKETNTAIMNSDINTYLNQIRGNLMSSDLSTTALVSNDITKEISIRDPLGTQILAKAGLKNNGWSVTSVKVEKTANISSSFYRLTLGINIAKDRVRVIGYPYQHKSLGDVYCNVINNIIVNCTGAFDTASFAQTTCQTMGGKLTNGACVVTPSGNIKGEHCND